VDSAHFLTVVVEPGGDRTMPGTSSSGTCSIDVYSTTSKTGVFSVRIVV